MSKKPKSKAVPRRSPDQVRAPRADGPTRVPHPEAKVPLSQEEIDEIRRGVSRSSNRSNRTQVFDPDVNPLSGRRWMIEMEDDEDTEDDEGPEAPDPRAGRPVQIPARSVREAMHDAAADRIVAFEASAPPPRGVLQTIRIPPLDLAELPMATQARVIPLLEWAHKLREMAMVPVEQRNEQVDNYWLRLARRALVDAGFRAILVNIIPGQVVDVLSALRLINAEDSRDIVTDAIEMHTRLTEPDNGDKVYVKKPGKKKLTKDGKPVAPPAPPPPPTLRDRLRGK